MDHSWGCEKSAGCETQEVQGDGRQHHAELLPFCVETCGGMAPDAIKLLSAMGDMGEEGLGIWPRHVVVRHLMGSVATAVQRGTAVAWLSAYSRSLSVSAMAANSGHRQTRREWDEHTGLQGSLGEDGDVE